MRTARAADPVFSRFFRQTDHALASFATAVNVCFSVAYAVALEAEEPLEVLDKAQKISIFLAPFV